MQPAIARSTAAYYEYRLVIEKRLDHRWDCSLQSGVGEVTRLDQDWAFEDDAKSEALAWAQFHVHLSMRDPRPVITHLGWSTTERFMPFVPHVGQTRGAHPAGRNAPLGR
jgi:hypothetical protein